MSTTPVAYNPSRNPIFGSEQIIDLAVGTTEQDYSQEPGGVRWWMSPDQSDGYVIAEKVSSGDQPTAPGINPPGSTVAFWKTDAKTSSDFLALAQFISRRAGTPPSFSTADDAKTWLNANGYWTSWGNNIPPGMVLYLDAGDSSSYPGSGSIWYDLSGNGNNGTLNSVSYITNGSDTMYFSGSSSYISFSSPTLIPIQNQQYTISIWMSANSMAGGYGLIGWGNYGINNQVNAFRILATNGLVNYWWNTDLAVYPSGFRAGPWFNVVATFDGTTRSIWVNGVSVATDTPTGHTVPNANNLTVGVTNGSEYFPGKIAEVLVYDTGLSGANIQAMYDAGKDKYLSPVFENLVLYHSPGDLSSYSGSGTTITDLSGNGRNGTMSNISFISPYFIYNGSSSQVSIADNALLEPGSGNWTMEVWVNQSVSGNDVVLGKFDPGGLSQDVSYSIRTTGTSFYAQIGSGSGSGGGPTGTLYVNSTSYSATIGSWMQLVYVFKNGATKTLETFVNGSSIGSVNHNLSSILNTSANLYIGSYNNGEYAQWFDGKIGITRLYSSALTSSQVLQNFNANKSLYGL